MKEVEDFMQLFIVIRSIAVIPKAKGTLIGDIHSCNVKKFSNQIDSKP